VGLFSWLFGKKCEPAATTALVGHGSAFTKEEVRAGTTHVEKREEARSGKERPLPATFPLRQEPVPTPAENLKRWRTSGQARAWIEARHGQWNHTDWLALLEELKRSPFWPMEGDEVGLVLETLKKERLNGR
jgi:hypothetical protein